MKKIFTLSTILFISILISSCSSSLDLEDSTPNETVRPVKVLKVKEEIHPVYLQYTGTVSPEDIKKFSFKSPGRVEKIYIEKGEHVEKGQPLVQLNKEDLNIALKVAKAQVDSAESQYNKAVAGASKEDITKAELNANKAQAAYDFALSSYESLKKLYEAGNVSKQDFDNAKLQLDLRESDLKIAKEIESQTKNGARKEDKEALLSQLRQAQANYENKESLLKDSTLKADTDGYIVDILYKEGELTSPGYPVVVLRREGQIIKTGISQNDRKTIETGMIVEVESKEGNFQGEISNINSIPDQQTLTYEAEISVEKASFLIGEVLNLSIKVGEKKGILIPIETIMSSTSDYVFVVKDSVAEKRQIDILDIIGTKVMVRGLFHDDILVTKGMKELNPGEKVKIKD